MKSRLRRLLTAPFLLLIQCYQVVLSPLFPAACRYRPTCSRYFAEALAEWGLLEGSRLGIKRILRCHPWHPGGYDPVPRRDQEVESQAGPEGSTPPPATPRPCDPSLPTPPGRNAS